MAVFKHPKVNDPTTCARVYRDVQARGVRAVSRALGLSRDATLSLALGTPVQAGTLALAREHYARIDNPETKAPQAGQG